MPVCEMSAGQLHNACSGTCTTGYKRSHTAHLLAMAGVAVHLGNAQVLGIRHEHQEGHMQGGLCSPWVLTQQLPLLPPQWPAPEPWCEGTPAAARFSVLGREMEQPRGVGQSTVSDGPKCRTCGGSSYDQVRAIVPCP